MEGCGAVCGLREKRSDCLAMSGQQGPGRGGGGSPAP